jgi:hypothetical protein
MSDGFEGLSSQDIKPLKSGRGLIYWTRGVETVISAAKEGAY